MKTLIYLQSQHIGFFCSIAKALKSEGHSVTFLARDNNVIKKILKNLPEGFECINFQEKLRESHVKELDSEAKRIEKNYNTTLSFIISQDRGLGRGYLTNIDYYPDIERASWSKEKKYKEVIEKFIATESTFSEIKPDLFLSAVAGAIFYTILEERKIKKFNFSPSKFEKLHFWSDNNFQTSQKLIDLVKANLTKKENELMLAPEKIETYERAKILYKAISSSYFFSLKRVIHYIVMEIYKILTFKKKKNSYVSFGWLQSLVRYPFYYRYIEKNSFTPKELKSKKIIYVPLHLEPEMSLMSVSPEFSNSIELISWISKSAPSDFVIVIKEQISMYGLRSKKYYKKFNEMANVVFADPKIPGVDWVKMCSMTASITGSAGSEAVFLGKPVLSFGKNQIINVLPSVKFCSNYWDTKKAIEILINISKDKNCLNISKNSLYDAIQKYSFSLNSKNLWTDKLFKMEDIKEAYNKLKSDAKI